MTALTQNGAPSPAAVRGDHVDLAAPAQHLNVALGAFGDCTVADTPGSDLATGLVAGAAALLVQRFPAAGPGEWAYRLQSSAVRPQSQTFRCERSLIVSVLDPGNECVPGQPMGVGAGSYGECSRQSGDDAWVGLGVRPFCVPQGEQRFWINGSGIWEHELGASGCGTGRPPNPRWLDPARSPGFVTRVARVLSAGRPAPSS